MNAEVQAPILQSEASVVGHSKWRVASVIWIVAGFLYPLLTPATAILVAGLQLLLSSAMGISEELAYRVAFTLLRWPMVALLGILVAVAQCAVVPELRPFARRWLIASAVGAIASTLVLLPSSLVLLEVTGASIETIRPFLTVPGAALLCGFASLLQLRRIRGRLPVPAWFVVAGVLGAMAGAFGEQLLALNVGGGLR